MACNRNIICMINIIHSLILMSLHGAIALWRINERVQCNIHPFTSWLLPSGAYVQIECNPRFPRFLENKVMRQIHVSRLVVVSRWWRCRITLVMLSCHVGDVVMSRCRSHGQESARRRRVACRCPCYLLHRHEARPGVVPPPQTAVRTVTQAGRGR